MKSPANCKTIDPPEDFAIYIVDLASDGPTPLGKVGLVMKVQNLDRRMTGLKSSAMPYYPVVRAGFSVKRGPKFGPRTTESWVHSLLGLQGDLAKVGEIFSCPDASLSLLVARVAQCLDKIGVEYAPVDVTALTDKYINKNLKIQQRFKKAKDARVPSLYEAWREEQSSVPRSYGEMARFRNRETFQNLSAVGELIADLNMGNPDPVFRSFGEMGGLKVYPLATLEAGLFEARAEQFLACPTTIRYKVDAAGHSVNDFHPVAMEIFDGETLTKIEIGGPFQVTADCAEGELRFTPDHLARLGDVATAPCQDWGYFAEGTRAKLTPVAYDIARRQIELLPGLRFWAGLQNAWERGFPVAQFEIPAISRDMERMLRKAATALRKHGQPVSNDVVDWAFYIFLAAA